MLSVGPQGVKLPTPSPGQPRTGTAKIKLVSNDQPEAKLLHALLTGHTFQRMLRELVEELTGVVDIALLERYQGGTLRIIPDGPQQPKDIPLEVFFKKIISVREKLRVLEQKINNHPSLTEEEKIDLEQYLTRAYGSLTTFNFLFQEKDDYFKGAGQ